MTFIKKYRRLYLKNLISKIVMFFCLIFLGINYYYGIERGLSSRIAPGDHDAKSISVAVSRITYNLHEGYIGYSSIYKFFTNSFFQNQTREGESFDRMYSSWYIQQVLDGMKNLNIDLTPPYKSFTLDFQSLYYEDVGYADFYTIAFKIFGYKYNAMYRAFFLLFSISIGLYIIAYWGLFYPMLALGMMIITFSFFIFSDIFFYGRSDLMPSFNSNRFMSVLGMIPMLHVAFTTSEKYLPAPRNLILIILQVLIFCLAMSIRKTALWQVYFLIIIAVINTASAEKINLLSCFNPFSHYFFRIKYLVLSPYMKSTYLSIIIIFCYSLLQSYMLNPIYQTNCATNGHLTWHTIFVSLSEHPRWEEYNNIAPRGMAGTDQLGWSTGVAELSGLLSDGSKQNATIYEEPYFSQHAKDISCPNTGLALIKTYEEAIKRVTIKFILQNPVYVAELLFIYKPLNIIKNLYFWKNINQLYLSFVVIISISAGFLCSIYAKDINTKKHSNFLILLCFMATGLAMLPNIIGLSVRLLPDLIWMSAITFSVSIWWISMKFTNRYLTSNLRC